MGDAPVPGWYHDPERAGWLRRWDGSAWADDWSPAPTVAPAPTPPIQPRFHYQSLGQPQPPAQLPGPSPAPTPSRPRRNMWIFGSIGAAVLLAVGAVVVWASATGGDSSDDVAGNDRGSSTQSASEDDESGDGDSSNGAEGSGDGSTRGDSGRGERLIESCGESELLSIPGTDVSIEPMTLEQERAIGADVNVSVSEFYATSNDSATLSTLDELLAELEPAGSAIPFTVTLLESDEVNAFAIPGGDLFFTTGITSLMNNDELAFVMAHEIAHVACRHLAQQFEREALVVAGIDALLGTELDTDRLYADAAAGVLTDLAGLSFSRDDETQSDIVALDLLTDASRPLDAGPSALRVLQGLEGGAEPSTFEVFLSTHPPTAERIERLEAEIAGR